MLFGVPIPVGSQSIWLALEISQAVNQTCNTRFDKVHLGPGTVTQRSGCSWTAVP